MTSEAVPGPGELLATIADVGVDRGRGGYSRHAFDSAEQQLREWFVEQADRRGLRVRTDRNANMWACWGEPAAGAVVTGSDLDSVPGGGAFDGPFGVASALTAFDLLRARGFTPSRPLAAVVFAEEEGGRFGVPCLGSRLLTGRIDPDRARALRDADGVDFAEAMRSCGMRPGDAGPDEAALRGIGRFVELHVEQGRGLVDLDRPVAVASSILAHGRWRFRFRFRGEGNHAGATRIEDRRDPMLPAPGLVLAARWLASRTADARATVGRLTVNPGGANVIASSVDVWLDARAPSGGTTRTLVDDLAVAAEELAAQEGCAVEESYGGTVRFDPALRDEVVEVLDGAPTLPTGAGHDAGILAARVPTSMLFVRNPTGVSHAPQEHAEPADCDVGAAALARLLERWAGRGRGAG